MARQGTSSRCSCMRSFTRVLCAPCGCALCVLLLSLPCECAAHTVYVRVCEVHGVNEAVFHEES